MSTTSALHSNLSSYFISPSEAHKALSSSSSSSSSPIPVSAAWFLPNSPHNGHSSFTKSHIPDSRFFDLDAISDTSSPYPHMLPSASLFASKVGHLGISHTDDLIIYDAPETGIFSAPRVAWTFRVFGHKGGVRLLNNYKKWVQEGLPTESGEQKTFPHKQYEAKEPDRGMVTGFETVRDIARSNYWEGEDDRRPLVLDARSKGRWEGTDAEPRKGLSSGHMPGSVSLPFTEVLDQEGKIKSKAELRSLFDSKGVSGSRPVVLSCGTGVTASVLEAALSEAGLAEGRRQVYDGSWTEYAQRAAGLEGLIEKSE